MKKISSDRSRHSHSRVKPHRLPRLGELEKRLVRLIRAVAPDALKETRRTAFAVLKQSATELRQTFIVGKDNSMLLPTSVAEVRNELARMQGALQRALQATENISPTAIRLLLSGLPDSPLGTLTHPLRHSLLEMIRVVEHAIALAERLPDKLVNPQKTLLAYDVALVLQDILKVKVTKTLASASPTAADAPFDRMLRIVGEMGGIPVPFGTKRLMQDAIELLANPYGDYHTPS